MKTASEICPFADDVWVYWMDRRAGTPYVKAAGTVSLGYTVGSQSVGLLRENWDAANDRQIGAMWAKYSPPRGIEGKSLLTLETE